MNYHFSLPIVAPSVNAMYKVAWGRKYLTNEARKWKRDAVLLLKNQKQKNKLKTITYPVEALILIPLKMHGDADNRIKLTQDALEAAGIIKNDNLIHAVTIRKESIEGCSIGLYPLRNINIR